MMKASDCAVATALVINGYLRANNGASPSLSSFRNAQEMLDAPLVAALSAIRQECHDWAESLTPSVADPNAAEPDEFVLDLSIGAAPASRSPYNLISAAIALVREAIALSGPEIIADFNQRLLPRAPRPKKTTERPEVVLLIKAADALAAEIDASADRPVQKLVLWDIATEKLRSLGVDPTERCVPVANW